MKSLSRIFGTFFPICLGAGALIFAVAACGDDDDAQPKADAGTSGQPDTGTTSSSSGDSGGDGSQQDPSFPQFVRNTIEKSTSETANPIPFADIEKVKAGADNDSDLAVFAGFF